MSMRTFTAGILVLGLASTAGTPALADGAASTRNLLIGGAAAAAGTLLIINHNKQVHQRYADDARQQAQTQAQANNAQAAYAAERRAYDNEVSVNSEFKHEVATQHSLIDSLRKQVAQEKTRADRAVAEASMRSRPVAVAPAVATPAKAAAPAGAPPLRIASTSWGWGQL